MFCPLFNFLEVKNRGKMKITNFSAEEKELSFVDGKGIEHKFSFDELDELIQLLLKIRYIESEAPLKFTRKWQSITEC